MSTDLFSIGRSGAATARAALDLTAQNIANAATPGYVRRGARIAEVAATLPLAGGVSLSGSRVAGTARFADPFRQSELRRTSGDQARADAELSGLRDAENALERSGLHPALVDLRAAFDRLAADPTDPALRSVVLEATRTAAQGFAIADQSLDAAQAGLIEGAAANTDRVNTLAQDLARVNLELARAGGGDRSVLLDRRDALLEGLSQSVDVATAFAADGTATVRIGGTSGPALVALGTVQPLTITTAANGTLSFALGGMAVSPSRGTLAGSAQALSRLAGTRDELDASAAALIATLNAAQANGAALDGSAGMPLLSGSGADDIALALTSAAQLATAPAGSPARSRDGSNLAALRAGLAASDPAGRIDALLLDVSGAIASRAVTRDALASIAEFAREIFSAQSGVDLDQEAVNLVRFQQAFQASGRVLQTAATLFDTLLGIR